MTDDIVDWLREYGERNATYQCCDAADEIEQLRAALRAIADHNAHGWTMQTELASAALVGEEER
jgi:hypothetical protein